MFSVIFMGDKKVDWIKIETDYISGDISCAELAKKHGVPVGTVRNHAARDNWTAKRELARQKTAETAAKKAVKNREAKAKIFYDLVDRMVDKVRDGVDRCDTANSAAVRQLTLALRDLQQMLGLDKTELDKSEQRARIERLRAETKAVAARVDAEGRSGDTVMIVLDVPPEGADDGQ